MQRATAAVDPSQEQDRPSKGGHSAFFHGTSSPQLSTIHAIDFSGEQVKRPSVSHDVVSPLQHKSKGNSKPPRQPAAVSTHAARPTAIEPSTERSRPIGQERPSHHQQQPPPPIAKKQRRTSHASAQNHVTLAELEDVEPFHSLQQPAAPQRQQPRALDHDASAIDVDGEDSTPFEDLDPAVLQAMADAADFSSDDGGHGARLAHHDDDAQPSHHDDYDDAEVMTTVAEFQSARGGGESHGPAATAPPPDRMRPLPHLDPDDFDDDQFPDDLRRSDPNTTGDRTAQRQRLSGKGAQIQRTSPSSPPSSRSPAHQTEKEQERDGGEQAALDWIAREFGGYVDFV